METGAYAHVNSSQPDQKLKNQLTGFELRISNSE